MIALIAIGVGAVWLYLPQAMQAAAIDAAYRSNIDVAEQIKITRGYYTQHVVAKATAAGTLNPTAIHAGDPGAIPLPATFVQDISNLLAKKATSLALVSPYPWPHRADRTMDAFQQRAWEIFRQEPDRIISATEVQNGQRVLRVAISDRMTNEACVACHNADAYSPRHDWAIGDVRAVMEVKRVIEPYLAAADGRSRRIILGVAGTALLVILLMTAIAMAVARSMRSKQDVDRHVLFLAHHDAMTGALNRSRFVTLLTDVIAQSEKAGRCADVALFYVDIDRFKEVNDRLGHAAGDQLIKAVVTRLRERLRDDDMIGRVGGDEFVIARVHDVDAADTVALAEAIVADMAMPFVLARHTLTVSASVGVRIGAAEVEDLMRAADVALYHAKSLGRSQAVLFSEDMQDELEARRHLEKTIRDTSRDCRFELHFQPLVSAVDRRLHGFEALLRLPDGKGGYIPPAQFIRVAEEIGMIGTIGAWALHQACMVAARWPSDHRGQPVAPAIRLRAGRRSIDRRHRRRCPGPFRPGAASAGTRGYRKRAAREHRGGHRRVARAEGARRDPGPRRFRHRLFEPELSLEASLRPPEDRPVLRRRPARGEPPRPPGRSDDHGAEPCPVHAGDGGRRGNGRAGKAADGTGLRPVAGLPFRPPLARSRPPRARAGGFRGRKGNGQVAEGRPSGIGHAGLSAAACAGRRRAPRCRCLGL
jgi:diguanylate cyclase (GGDEF)-like protein